MVYVEYHASSGRGIDARLQPMSSDQADDDEDIKLFPTKKPSRSPAEIDAAEKQIVEQLKDVRYVVREYPTEVVVQKYLLGRNKDENEVYVPDYQRELIWPERHKSRFIESLLIGFANSVSVCGRCR
jgi:hypothetical protein